MKTLADAFEQGLMDVHHVETVLAKAWSSLAQCAGNRELKAILDGHVAQTDGQIVILKDTFRSIGKKPARNRTRGVEGLVRDAEQALSRAEGAARDAVIIGCAQCIEHTQISRYGTLREWAKTLGYDEAHALLTTNLEQEKAVNSRLNNLAINTINKSVL
jgi:ferritin-like metal-binding protein YciE